MNRAHVLKGLFFLLAILVVLSDGRRRRNKKPFFNRRNSNSNSTEFDVLIFTQHWPQTVCYTWKEKSENHQCSLPRDEEWSIHGIWPTKFHEIGPLYCNKSLPFNYKAIQQLENQLNTKWVDVEIGRANHAFWTHEWEKHGTCAMVLEPLDNEFKYFKKGLDFFDTYDMKNVLGKSLILPGRGYKVQQIIDAVHRELGKTPQVECVVNPKTKEVYLFEIRICFDKKLNLVDCDGVPGYPTNCSKKKNIIYPGEVPVDHSVIVV